MKNQRTKRKSRKNNRRGATSLDYILIIGVILPLLLFLFAIVPRMIRLVYEMAVVLIGSPLG